MSDFSSDNRFVSRLSRISTRWSVVFEAHNDESDQATLAKKTVLDHYSGAVYRYLLGAVRDPETAEELSHEFALRFLRGDFHRVNPDRGRFRDYVKTVLINLINDHFRSIQQRPRHLSPDAPDPAVAAESVGSEPSFEDCLKQELLDQAWEELRRQNERFHTILLYRVENPDLSSRELAAGLEADKQVPINAANVRKTIERARIKFAELLVERASQLLDCDDADTLGRELKQLGMLGYCRPALEKRSLPERENAAM